MNSPSVCARALFRLPALACRLFVAGDVADAALGGELAELLPAAVIQQVDADLLRRPVDRHAAQHGRAHDGHRFVVRGNVHVHGRPQRDIFRHRDRPALQRPKRLHVAEHEHEDGVALGQGQADAEQQFDHAGEIQRLRHPPEDVAQRHGQAEDDEEDRHVAAFEPVRDQEHDRRGDGEDRLLPRVELDGCDGDDEGQSQDAADDVDQPAGEAAMRHALPPRLANSDRLTHCNKFPPSAPKANKQMSRLCASKFTMVGRQAAGHRSGTLP